MVAAYVRIAGYGVRVLPRAPFVARMGQDSIEFTVDDEAGERAVRVDATTGFGAHEFGDLFAGPVEKIWTIEVGGVYEARWPAGLLLRSWPDPEQPPFFFLDGAVGSLIYVQGPFPTNEAPSIDGMIGSGQTELGRGGESPFSWIQLGYLHHEESWIQRHIRFSTARETVVVVTAQARAAASAALGILAMELARSVRLP